MTRLQLALLMLITALAGCQSAPPSASSAKQTEQSAPVSQPTAVQGRSPGPPTVAADASRPIPLSTPNASSDNRLTAINNLSVEQIGMLDPVMRQLLSELTAREDELVKLSAQLGDQHPHIARTRDLMERNHQKIEAHAIEWRKAQAAIAQARDREAAELAVVFAGVVDVYLDPDELKTRQPAISGARFDQTVDVLGRKMIRFTRTGEQWLVDPARIIAVRRVK